VNGHLGPEELTSIFSSFANQLLGLLGVPKLPPNVKRSSSDSAAILSDWQLDALLRRRALENASGSQDTLRSIVKLVAEIENMPVGSEVRDDVENALEALTKVRCIHCMTFFRSKPFIPRCTTPLGFPCETLLPTRLGPLASPLEHFLVPGCWRCCTSLQSTNTASIFPYSLPL